MLHGSPYFSAKEFACKCGCGFGSKEEDIAADLIHLLHVIRAKLARPFVITSGARCAKHNQDVGGEPRSTHLPGEKGRCTPGFEGKCRAADIRIAEWSTEDRGDLVHMALACEARVGVGSIVFIHIDVETEPFYSEGVFNYTAGETSSTQ